MRGDGEDSALRPAVAGAAGRWFLEDGTVVRAWCRLKWTPDTELAAFEGLDERERG